MNAIINHAGFSYSVSDKNAIGEFVVVKVKEDVEGSKEIVEARIIKAGSYKKVKNIILNGSFKQHRILEGSDRGAKELLN